MGHVPSKDHVAEPFTLDLYSSSKSTGKNNGERIVAIGLTNRYFKSADDPLFSKFCSVRAENPVRHWYCRPNETSRDELPDVPSNEQIYQRMVLDASAIVDQDLPVEKFTPLPVMIVKMDDHTSTEVPNGSNCTVLGYFGCRHFGSNGIIGEEGVLGIFISTKFYNEAKSLACIQLASACYDHFCRKIGLTTEEGKVPWPQAFRYDTFETNLPCLRLTQKLHSVVHAAGIKTEDGIKVDKNEGRAYFRAYGDVLRLGVEHLISGVKMEKDEEKGIERRVLKVAQVPFPAETDDNIKSLNAFISHAKASWSEANLIVVKKQLDMGRDLRGKAKIKALERQKQVAKITGEETPILSRTNSESKLGPRTQSDPKVGSDNSGNEESNQSAATPSNTTTTGAAGSASSGQVKRQNSNGSTKAGESVEVASSSAGAQSGGRVGSAGTKPKGGRGVIISAPTNLLTPPALENNNSSAESIIPLVSSQPGSTHHSRAVSPTRQREQQQQQQQQNNSTSTPVGVSGVAAVENSSMNMSSSGNKTHDPYGYQLGGSTTSQPGNTLHSVPIPVGGAPQQQQQQQQQQRRDSGIASGSPVFSDPHHPRDTLPLKRTASQGPAGWEAYRASQQRASPSYVAPKVDPRLFIGERTPVYICTTRRQWEPKYWRNPMSPLVRSNWQPHLPNFVCYETDHREMQLYDEYWRPVTQLCEPLIFLENGERIFALEGDASYIQMSAQ